MSRVPFAYPPDGSVLVMGDGPELFVFGANDGPLWRKFTDGVLVGVGGSQQTVVSLDSDGRLISWRGLDGYKLDEHQLDVPGIFGLVMRPDGACAVLAADQVVITSPKGGGNAMPAPGVTTVAWNPKGEFAVGTDKGSFQVFDTSGKPLGSCSVGAAITGIAYRPQGQWLVAAGTKVTPISADGKTPAAAVDAGGPTGALACTADGALFAVMSGPQQVAVGEFANNKRLGFVTWQRDVSGIAFGRDAWLAIGLDEAEANRVELATGETRKTEGAQGKVAGKWSMKVELEPMQVRQAITKVRSAGKALATHVDHYDKGGGFSCLQACGVIFVLSLLCSGCSGILFLLYKFVYVG